MTATFFTVLSSKLIGQFFSLRTPIRMRRKRSNGSPYSFLYDGTFEFGLAEERWTRAISRGLPLTGKVLRWAVRRY